jgi:hypothetical protein
MPEDAEVIEEVYGERAARRYRGLTDLRQMSLSDYRRERGAIPR